MNGQPEPATRPLYWSVQRELWENRSLYFAPLAVAVVVLIGFFFSLIGLPERRRAVLLLDEAKQQAAIGKPYDLAATILIFTAFVVGILYCIDALYGERRDRSILFWKSLPVSDRTTVLSKAAIPLVVLPALLFAIIVTTQIVMMMAMSAVLTVNGLDPATTWKHYNMFEQSAIHIYGLTAIALWHAPIYGWLLFVSGWARRATFLWALLPFFAIGVLERLALNSSHFGRFLKYRVMDGIGRAFDFKSAGMTGSLADLTPGRFLTTPGLWAGLAFAAAFVGVAIRMRRLREPI